MEMRGAGPVSFFAEKDSTGADRQCGCGFQRFSPECI